MYRTAAPVTFAWFRTAAGLLLAAYTLVTLHLSALLPVAELSPALLPAAATGETDSNADVCCSTQCCCAATGRECHCGHHATPKAARRVADAAGGTESQADGRQPSPQVPCADTHPCGPDGSPATANGGLAEHTMDCSMDPAPAVAVGCDAVRPRMLDPLTPNSIAFPPPDKVPLPICAA